MAGLVVHLFTYAAVCGFLVCVWAFTSGSFDEVAEIARHPETAVDRGFWPVWVILAWGTAVVIHFGAVLADVLFGARARRRRRRLARLAGQLMQQAEGRARHRHARHRTASPSAPPTPPPATEARVRRWVSVMFTDIADSTHLAEELGDDEWSRVLGRYRSLVRAAFLARGGEEVGTQGDGFLGRFPSPAEAVLCGVDIQREMGEIDEHSALELHVRIGIHAGEAVEDEGDLIGRVVNLAARVTAEAEPGEILVTEPVADYLGGRLRFEDRGLRPLKGVTQPRHLLAVVWDGGDPVEV